MLDSVIIERHPPRSELQARGLDLPQLPGRKARPSAVKLPPSRSALGKIMAASYQDVRWAVPGLVPEGLSILAGRQKLGKSWLALDLALAVGNGGVALGTVPCEQGDVLYIDLENGERRIQRRVRTLQGDEQSDAFERVEVQTKSSNLGPDFLEELDDWRLSVEVPKLVIVDVLQRIKPVGEKARNAYENDYAALSSLQQWATGHAIAVLLIHHTRKGGADDPLEALSGSNGLSACADATLLLDRKGSNCTLYVRGRDVEETETALLFNDGRWIATGDAAEVHRTSARNSILATLEENREAMTPTEIASVIGSPVNNVRQMLFKMKASGEVRVVGQGRYVHPDHHRVIATEPDNARGNARGGVEQGPPDPRETQRTGVIDNAQTVIAPATDNAPHEPDKPKDRASHSGTASQTVTRAPQKPKRANCDNAITPTPRRPQ